MSPSARLFFLLWVILQPQVNAVVATARQSGGRQVVRYIENKGQWEPRVMFRGEFPGGSVFLEKGALTYLLSDFSALHSCHHETTHPSSGKEHLHPVPCHAFRLSFVRSGQNVTLTGSRKRPEYFNYFIGNDPSAWAAEAAAYEKVTCHSLYAGIDLDIASFNGWLKYEFRVGRGADPGDILMRYEGQDSLMLIDGKLVVRTSVTNLIEQQPWAFQVVGGDTLTVPCEYRLKGNDIRFSLPAGYDTSLPLVIDPVVIASTYTGSVGNGTWGHTATYDIDGNIYLGGRSLGTGYPATLGAFQLNFGGGSFDATISKFNPDGSLMFWATYVGGSGEDLVHSIAANDNGEVFMYGSTQSSDYPVVPGCFQTSFGGNVDILITRLNNTGTALIGSTFLGGSGVDGRNTQIVNNYGDEYRGEIILDPGGNPCIASFTGSTNFPVTAGAFDQTYNGGQDGVLCKLNAALTQLQWSAYLGGGGHDAAFGIKLNSVGMVYVTGGTKSSDFPTTTWVMNPSWIGGESDGFICIFQPDLSSMIAGTYFGTTDADICFFIQMDLENNVYIFGQSDGNIPVTAGCYGNPGSPQFIVKLDQTLNGILYSSVFGNGTGAGKISPTAFLVDICQNVYAVGWGNTTGFPVTPDAVQSVTDGKDFYLFSLGDDATQLAYATFYGAYDPSAYGDHVDGGTSSFDKRGVIYEAVCACASTNPFPTTPNAWEPDPPAYPPTYCDVAVFKMDFQLSGPTAEIGVLPADTGCRPFQVTFTNTSVNAAEYIWDFGDGSDPAYDQFPAHTYDSTGTFVISCIAIDSASCFVSDTAYLAVTVWAVPLVDLGPDTLICGSGTITLDAKNPGSSYLWSTGATSQQITVSGPGTVWVTVENGSCSDSDTLNISFVPEPELGPDTSLCEGATLTLSSGMPGYLHLWSTGAVTPSIQVSATGWYWVEITEEGCVLRDSAEITFLPNPIVDLGPDREICQGESAMLDAGFPDADYLWNTAEVTRTITVTLTGDYSVTVTVGNCTGSGSVHVEVLPVPQPALPDDRYRCENETILLDPGNTGSQFAWSTGATSQAIPVTDSGLYVVTVSTGNCAAIDSVFVHDIILSVGFWNDTLLCPGEKLVLDAGNPGSFYHWNTGSENQTLPVFNPGTYWVIVGRMHCTVSDTIRVATMNPLELPEVLNLCGRDYVTMASNVTADEYLWSDGSMTPEITVNVAGVYVLRATRSHCVLTDSTLVIGVPGISTFYVPNSFSPNRDQVNDHFTAYGTDITRFRLQVFDRWGELIFETVDQLPGWDGTYLGRDVPDGVYTWVIRYATNCSFEQELKEQGTVTVIR